jgi:DNA sulfur modification protein DndB
MAEANTPYPLYDPASHPGTPYQCLVVDATRLVISPPVRDYLSIVADLEKAEFSIRQAEKNGQSDEEAQALVDLFATVQRSNRGRKKRNVADYAQYLGEVTASKRMGDAPPPVLFSPNTLQVVLINGMTHVVIPQGPGLVTIDGDTQTRAWRRLSLERRLTDVRIPAEIRHGVAVEFGEQIFHDRNVLRTVVSASDAIAKDNYDFAKRLAEKLIPESSVLNGRIKREGRSVARTDQDHVTTIGALRTGMITSILGSAGLQVGSRSFDLPEGVDERTMVKELIPVWLQVLDHLKPEFNDHATTVVGNPAILAGIGALVHRTTSWSATKPLSVEDVLALLEDVDWQTSHPTGGTVMIQKRVRVDGQSVEIEVEVEARESVWSGIAGKFTPSMAFSMGGPKEVGHAVINALSESTSVAGKSIRKG